MLNHQNALEKFVIQRTVVMIIMTARSQAGIEFQAFMGRSFAAHFVMTIDAIIFGNGDGHVEGAFRDVFAVTGDTVHGIDLLQTISVTRVFKFLLG